MLVDFYTNNYDRLVNTVSKKVAGNYDVAEDVVQESFEKAHRFIKAYDEDKGKFSTWFNTIMYNVLRDVQRRNKNSPEEFVEELTASDVLNGVNYSEEMTKEIREQIYSSRNLKHRDILEMFFVYGFTSKEIPYMLEGVTQSNVTTVVQRFKEKL